MFHLDSKTGDFVTDNGINLGDYIEVVPTGEFRFANLYDYVTNAPEPNRAIAIYEFKIVFSSLSGELTEEFISLSKSVQRLMIEIGLALHTTKIILKSKKFKFGKWSWYSPVFDEKSIRSLKIM